MVLANDHIALSGLANVAGPASHQALLLLDGHPRPVLGST